MVRYVVSLLVVLSVAGCSRDSSEDLRARLSNWFYLGDTVSFKSQMRCTAAVYKVTGDTTRPMLPVQIEPNRAKEAFSIARTVAFRMEGYSPNDLTDELLLTGRGTFGKQALASAAQAVPCFRETSAEAGLRDALTRPGATLAYDRDSEGLMVLDPVAMRLFYVAGDTW